MCRDLLPWQWTKCFITIKHCGHSLTRHKTTVLFASRMIQNIYWAHKHEPSVGLCVYDLDGDVAVGNRARIFPWKPHPVAHYNTQSSAFGAQIMLQSARLRNCGSVAQRASGWLWPCFVDELDDLEMMKVCTLPRGEPLLISRMYFIRAFYCHACFSPGFFGDLLERWLSSAASC